MARRTLGGDVGWVGCTPGRLQRRDIAKESNPVLLHVCLSHAKHWGELDEGMPPVAKLLDK